MSKTPLEEIEEKLNGITLEEALGRLTVLEAQIVHLKFKEESYVAIGLAFEKSEGWVEGVMRAVYEKLGIEGKTGKEKSDKIKKYYKPLFMQRTGGDYYRIPEIFGPKEGIKDETKDKPKEPSAKAEPEKPKVEPEKSKATDDQVKIEPTKSKEELPHTDQKTVEVDRGERARRNRFPGLVIIVLLLILGVLLTSAVLFGRPIFEAIIQTAIGLTQTTQPLAPQVSTNTAILEPTNTQPIVPSETSLPTSTDTVVIPTPTIVQSSPTLVSRPIPFGAPDDPTALNPAFGWQPGASQASSYQLSPDSGVLTLIAGSDTNQWERENSGPLLIYPIEGNFEVQVKATITSEKNFQLAGLGIKSVGDNTTWIRVDRGYSYGQSVEFAAMNKGRVALFERVPYSDNTVFLRIEKNGSLVTLSQSANGTHWITLEKDFVVEMPNEVEIYLFAFSNTNIGTVAQFSDFQVFHK